MEEIVPFSLPSVPDVHPVHFQRQISLSSAVLPWEVPFWGFSDLFQSREPN